MRQKSMIDLRDPLFLEQQQRQHLAAQLHLQQQQHQQQQQQQQQYRRYPGLMRSATEHDIKVRQRRSMATGDPLDDLPPLLRRQMVGGKALKILDRKKVRNLVEDNISEFNYYS